MQEIRQTVDVEHFESVDVRVGTIREAGPLEEARTPLHRLMIDFGPEIGTLRSAAGLPANYDPADLVGRQVLAVVNLPSRPIGGFESECLTLGVPDADGEPVLVAPDRRVPDGGRLY